MKEFYTWLGGYLQGKGVDSIKELDAEGVGKVVDKLLQSGINEKPQEWGYKNPTNVYYTNFDELFKFRG